MVLKQLACSTLHKAVFPGKLARGGLEQPAGRDKDSLERNQAMGYCKPVLEGFH